MFIQTATPRQNQAFGTGLIKRTGGISGGTARTTPTKFGNIIIVIKAVR
jgi:hypothetical protein